MSTKVGDIFVRANLDKSAYNKGLKSLDTGTSKLASSITRKIAGALTAGAIAKGFSSIIKEGAKLEQAFGGIETMFGGMSDKMTLYAMQAYKTAGISANAYMEQATSFSASLLQSLNGDQAKSAEIANQAIIDMSDNSNKFGTAIENLQNAYQGFAKQNFTMLDNLKLGYGGTRTEMQRLLAKAQELSGRAFDINSLADIYQAIHVIQENMGVAGTTAQEAMSTWSGAVNMAKASFSNFMATIGQGIINILQPLLRAFARLADAMTALGVRFLQWTEMITGKARGVGSAIKGALGKGTEKQVARTGNAIGGAGDATKGLGGNAKKAKKEVQALKRELLGFDRITKLSGESGVSTGGTGTSGGGGISAGGIDFSQAEADTESFSNKATELLQGIELPQPLKQALADLKKSFDDLLDTLSGTGKWVLDNVLKPFGEWTINELVPAQVETLAKAFEALDKSLQFLGEILEPLWNPALKPFFKILGELSLNPIHELGTEFDILATVLEKATGFIKDFKSGWENIESWFTEHKATIKAEISDTFSDKIGALKTKWADAKKNIVNHTATITAKLKDSFSSKLKSFKTKWNNAKNAIKGKTVELKMKFTEKFVSLWNGMVKKINAGRDKSAFLKKLFPNKLPTLAQGGWVKANTPTLAMIGDNKREGEIVAPESKLRAMAQEVANGSNGEVVRLLSALLTAVQGIDPNVYLDGEAIKNNTVRRINNHTRATGQLEIIV